MRFVHMRDGPMIPRRGFTVSNDCNLSARFFKEWHHASWSMTCFDDRGMHEILQRYGVPPLRLAIQRADVARFLLLYERGGLYVDTDVYPLRGTGFRPEPFLDANGVVFGYEAIVSQREQRRYGIYRPKSLCMWTVFSVPRSPVLLSLAHNLSGNALRSDVRASQTFPKTFPTTFPRTSPKTFPTTRSTTLNELVHKTTGPTAVTDFMLSRLSAVAPVVAFGCGQEHSRARKCAKEVSFCRHGFAGSWRRP